MRHKFGSAVCLLTITGGGAALRVSFSILLCLWLFDSNGEAVQLLGQNCLFEMSFPSKAKKTDESLGTFHGLTLHGLPAKEASKQSAQDADYWKCKKKKK